MKLIILLSVILLIFVSLYHFYTKKENFNDEYSDIVANLANEESNLKTKERKKQVFDGRYKRQTIDEQFDQLNKFEKKCHEYFNQIRNRHETEKQKQLDNMTKELDVQDKKIQELQKLVNIYRNQYLVRKGITNKCREKTQNKLEDDILAIEKLTQEGKLVNQNIKLDVKIKDDEHGDGHHGHHGHHEHHNNKFENTNKFVDINDEKFAERVNERTNTNMGTDLKNDALKLSLSKYI